MFVFRRGQLDVFETMAEEILRRPVATPVSDPSKFPGIRRADPDLGEVGGDTVGLVDDSAAEGN